MKGIILAGGEGTRLHPLTLVTSKQLLPVYNKPMIYYPLATLMQAGIHEILIISSPQDLPRFEKLLSDGSSLGLKISYCVQEKPRGIAEAFIIAESFIQSDPVALVLGDNLFYGLNMERLLMESSMLKNGGIVFGYEVVNPTRYGVIAFDKNNKIVDIIEKPTIPPSNYAVTGLYFYDSKVVEIAKKLKPSKRGELEITDVNSAYLKRGELTVKLFDRGSAWLDTGTHEALHNASNFVQMVEERQGIRIGCIEEIAFQKGLISLEQFEKLAEKANQSAYGSYLMQRVISASEKRMNAFS
ncbi:MAG: glucose-1-phosphate thymidylyltransferase RfbA [Simkaniaceae bacterium]